MYKRKAQPTVIIFSISRVSSFNEEFFPQTNNGKCKDDGYGEYSHDLGLTEYQCLQDFKYKMPVLLFTNIFNYKAIKFNFVSIYVLADVRIKKLRINKQTIKYEEKTTCPLLFRCTLFIIAVHTFDCAAK